jgi:hypothetical protein
MKGRSLFVILLLLSLSGIFVHNAYSCSPPVAVIHVDYDVTVVNSGVTFMSYSGFGDGNWATSYSWDLGSDAVVTGGATSSRWVTCIYTTVGPKTATLTITDNLDRTDTDTCVVSIVKIEITDPNYNPTDKKHFTFNSASPGVCAVTATGTSGVAGENYKLNWTLTAISDSTQTSSPSPAKGANITFTYTTLPSTNDFGNKILTLTHPEMTFFSSDSEIIRIFFGRDNKNHAGTGSGITRNWYYYWKEGGVVGDLAIFEYTDQNLFGKFDPNTGKLYVGNLAPEDNDGPITVTKKHTYITAGANGVADTTAQGDDVQVIPVNQGEPNSTIITSGSNHILNTTPSGDDAGAGGGQQESIGANGKGIDCCVETCSHEEVHKLIKDTWDGPWNGQTDTDGDGIPDCQEEDVSPYNFNMYDPDTYNLAGSINSDYATYGDQEFLARKAEQSPHSVVPGADWSDTNGKNWVPQ